MLEWVWRGTEPEDNGFIKFTAVRELQEETRDVNKAGGLITFPSDLIPLGVVHFHNTNESSTVFVVEVHFYFVDNWKGEPFPNEEMGEHCWFSMDDLPLETMMAGDRDYVPGLMAGKKIKSAHIYYTPKQKELARPSEIEWEEQRNAD